MKNRLQVTDQRLKIKVHHRWKSILGAKSAEMFPSSASKHPRWGTAGALGRNSINVEMKRGGRSQRWTLRWSCSPNKPSELHVDQTTVQKASSRWNRDVPLSHSFSLFHETFGSGGPQQRRRDEFCCRGRGRRRAPERQVGHAHPGQRWKPPAALSAQRCVAQPLMRSRWCAAALQL